MNVGVGARVGERVGLTEGFPVGCAVGKFVGSSAGRTDAIGIGAAVEIVGACEAPGAIGARGSGA